jgi:hypothetical protein
LANPAPTPESEASQMTRISVRAARDVENRLSSFNVGSGRRGRTWLFEREGYRYEFPINGYAKQHLWDMAQATSTLAKCLLR